MNKMVIFFLAMPLSACSIMSPIENASKVQSQFDGKIYIDDSGKETTKYIVFHQGSTGFSNTSIVKESATGRAKVFCKEKGNKDVSIVNEREWRNWNFPRAELIFECIDKNTSTTNKYDELAKLKNLLDSGALTQQEFEMEKIKLLK